MSTVSVILAEKGSKVWSVSPTNTVYDALELMADKDIGAVVVLENGRLAGIFSERDYARKVVLKGKTSRDTLIKDVMSVKVSVVGPENSLDESLGVMTAKKFRHLPVMSGDSLEGIISIGDVVKQILNEKQFVIDQLESYIKGG
jgi:CBS domain-containing protein